jgi:hypothetical protein
MPQCVKYHQVSQLRGLPPFSMPQCVKYHQVSQLRGLHPFSMPQCVKYHQDLVVQLVVKFINAPLNFIVEYLTTR